MNLSELKKLSAFAEPARISEFTVGKCLTNLKYYGQRIMSIYSQYEALDPKSDSAMIMLDAIKNNFNDYVQVFIDIVLVVCDDSVVNSLGSAVRAFISKFNPKEPELSFVNFLNERNSIIHEYYNREFLDERIRVLLSNYADGALGIVRILDAYVMETGLTDVLIKKGKK